MNARGGSHPRSSRSGLRDKLRSCLFPALLASNLAAIAVIVLQTRDSPHGVLDVIPLAVLIAALG